MALDAPTIAQILGAPLANVQANWPLIQAALQAEGIGSELVQVAALATLGTETPAFAPLRELSPRNEDRTAYFQRMYWANPLVRHRLGNLTPQDAAAYFGRGFIQLTGRDNYHLYGELLGLDLLTQPDLALDPANSARIFAAFFRRARVAEAAEARDWFRVRCRVNGGSNGWERFSSLVNQLLAAAHA